ncbi:MAG: hypothetical protein CVT84_17645, partial [Alphaproteobacteria bacterium HGW-Alphaproteobacteria-6]
MAEAVDVVVVGCGYAGAMAAIAAADAGARVLVLEKAPRPGGISICSAGGVRIAADAGLALAYLEATCGGRTPGDVLAVLARGMTGLAEDLRALAAPVGAEVAVRAAPGNYPLPGTATFGFATIEAIPGFDPATAYPDVRGGRAGALLFRVLEAAMAARPAITLCCATPVARLVVESDAEIDREDVRIEREAVDLLTDAMDRGVKLDHYAVRMILTIVKVNNEFERISDCAVNIAERIDAFMGLDTEMPPKFHMMANSVIGIMQTTITALETMDTVAAQLVLASDDATEAFKDAILRDTEQQLVHGEHSVDYAFALRTVAVNLAVALARLA